MVVMVWRCYLVLPLTAFCMVRTAMYLLSEF